jgi:polyhydroxybutyrate depolymerase
MRTPPPDGIVVALALIVSFASARASDVSPRREWTVDGLPREALVYVPTTETTQPTPVIFAFHGHTGKMDGTARWGLHKLWPEALVIYPQGVPTPGMFSDPAGEKSGWQTRPGQVDDRDLKFVDKMLATVRREYRVDDRRVFATGISNGGIFTYLLWAERGTEFAAVAPMAAIDAVQPGEMVPKMQPKPVLHIFGERDESMKVAWQQKTIEALRKLNQCSAAEPTASGIVYPSKLGAPVIAFAHPGGHGMPASAPARIVAFFREHAKP